MKKYVKSGKGLSVFIAVCIFISMLCFFSTPASAATTIWTQGSSPYQPCDSIYGQWDPLIWDGSILDCVCTRYLGGHDVYRTQIQPLEDGNVQRLARYGTYTWQFQAVTKLGMDCADSDRIVWQIHDYSAGTSPVCTLSVHNYGGRGQKWAFQVATSPDMCGFEMPYTENATDNWEIQAYIDYTDSGWAKLYRNGVLQCTLYGATYRSESQGDPWWDYGIYQWCWQASMEEENRSSLSFVEIIFNSMVARLQSSILQQ